MQIILTVKKLGTWGIGYDPVRVDNFLYWC